MRKKNDVDVFSATNSLKILSFLVDNLGRELLSSEIQEATSMSRAGVYIALRELIKQKLVLKTQKGKFIMYFVVYDEPVIKQFKILKNVLLLKFALLKFKPLSKKIVLYGSASRGEDTPNSDIDLFMLSKEPEAIKVILPSLKLKRKIQVVIKSPSEWADFKETEKVFYEEVSRGIVLWEEKE